MSHQAAADALPLRDAFAVLFFVSVGMLLDPSYLVANPLAVLALLVLIMVIQPLVAFTVVVVFGYPLRTALTVGAGLGQIGEFSFILGTMGLTLGLLPADGFQLIVAGALLSIAVNPVLFGAIEPLERRLRDARPVTALSAWHAGDRGTLPGPERATLRQHAILCGYGRVGGLIGPALERRGFTYVVVTQAREQVDRLRARGIPAIYGDAADPAMLELAGIASARLLIVATAEGHVTRLIVERAHAARPDLDIVVRTHSDTEAMLLRAVGTRIQAVHGERELAVQMARYSLRRFGVSATEAESIAQGLRPRSTTVPGQDRGGRPGVVKRLRARLRRPAAEAGE
jgi:K+:H+ antiporter